MATIIIFRLTKFWKKKAISIRVSENNIYELKKKVLENGVPYQNIIQMLIHQLASNKIKLSV